MIDRRTFLKNSGLATAGMLVLPTEKEAISSTPLRDKMLNAYYLRAHMYTIVPRQVREDFKWMAGIGTNTVSIAILEQDLTSAVENINIICEEAERVGINVFAVPSRWGGMLAGAPKVPSVFSVINPKTWILKKDGAALTNNISGVISSVHYPETAAFFKTSLDKILSLWKVKGIIWDEPKSFILDYSPNAIEKLGKEASLQTHVKAVIEFYSEINNHIKQKHPGIITNMFAYANLPDMIVQEAAKTQQLDYFGCDGRPWRNEDGGQQEGEGKVLLGAGERFIKEAKSNSKKSMWLIENHNMPDTDLKLLDKRMPEVLEKGVDQLLYYYYPRNIQSPDKCMSILAKHLKKFK
ncbi:MAG TPA: hypothetical protein VF487_16010 [Chitinophagaceae bacterium]